MWPPISAPRDSDEKSNRKVGTMEAKETEQTETVTRVTAHFNSFELCGKGKYTHRAKKM